MKNLLIGSRALAFWNPKLCIKETTDYDVISDEPIEGTEWHDPSFLNNKKFEKYASDVFTYINGNKVYVVNMKGLAIIKRSHLWRQLSFQKHITHYHKYGLHKELDNLDDEDAEVLTERISLTHKEFGIKYPSLNKTKEEFFDDGIYRRYDHDLLHEIVAYYNEPLYKKLITKNDKVFCELYNWANLSYEDKVLCVSEEVYVTALERFIFVEHPIDFKAAYLKSLDKVCTTMCSGWFRYFAIDNYPQIFEKFDNKKIKSVIEELHRRNL